jgi:hypothetical protein
VRSIGKVPAGRQDIDFSTDSALAVAGVPAADVRSMILFHASAAAIRISGEPIAADGDHCQVT